MTPPIDSLQDLFGSWRTAVSAYFGQLQRWIKGTNLKKLLGSDGWRLPAIDKVLSLLGKEKNTARIFIRVLTVNRDISIPLTGASRGVLVC